jgi:hypothetical protein
MELRHSVQRFLMSIVCNQPSWCLWEKWRTDKHCSRKHHLQPKRYSPGLRALNILRSKRNKTAWNAADVPERVENARTHASIDGMRHFADVCGSCGRCDGNTKPEDEATTHEPTKVGACRLYTCADHDDAAADKHAPFSSSEICCWTCDKRSHQVPNGVDGIYDTRSRRSHVEIEAEVGAILLVFVDGTHE